MSRRLLPSTTGKLEDPVHERVRRNLDDRITELQNAFRTFEDESSDSSAPSGTGVVSVTAGVFNTPYTDAQLTTHIDSFTSLLKGAAPASGGGTSTFLRADATWAAPTTTIGNTVTSGTAGSVLFIGAGPVLAQDNANFFWDATNKRLGLGTTSPGFALAVHEATLANANDVLEIRNKVATGYSTIWFTDSTGTDRCHVGFANASAPITYLRGFAYYYTTNGTVFSFSDITARAIDISPLSGSVGMEFANGSSYAVSASSKGRVRYNTTGQKFQISANTGAYLDVTLSATALSTGSVPFGNASGNLAQDASTFLWNNTSKGLRVGASAVTLASVRALDVSQAISADVPAFFWNTNTAGYSGIGWNDTAIAYKGSMGYGNSTVAIVAARLKNFFASGGPDYVFIETTTSTMLTTIFMTAGSAGIALANGSSLAVSAANTCNLRWNNGTSKLQISKSGAAYVDII